MRTLANTLTDYEIDLLQIIANRWDIDLKGRVPREAAQQLAEAMLDPTRAEREWERLHDKERGALQMVLGANKDHKMSMVQFGRLFGEIRTMGEEKRQREKPHLAPVGIAEILYYRGLVSITFDQGKAGAQAFVYVPHDLADILPIHRTGYDRDTPADEPSIDPVIAVTDEPTYILKASTLLIDDLTTMLAYLRTYDISLEAGYIPEATEKILLEYMLGEAVDARFDLILRLVWELGLIKEIDSYLRVMPESRPWLERPRTEQAETLIKTWYKSQLYNEIFHIPTFQPEMTNWRNDPTLLREAILNAVGLFSDEGWFSIAEVIEEIKATEPDFQRAAGNYDSWYIREIKSGKYLKGFESWDQVEGVMLQFAITGPMYWLGLVDLGASREGEAPIACRLTAFGKAWVNMEENGKFPQRPDPESKITFEGERLLVPRLVSRFDRFQVARFTTWEKPSEPFIYTLTAESLQNADKQGIKLEHIQAFIQRTTGQTISTDLIKKMTSWLQAGTTHVVLQRLVVLRVDSERNLDAIWDKPNLRRYLSGRLGPKAVAVREDQWEALVAALEGEGMTVELQIE